MTFRANRWRGHQCPPPFDADIPLEAWTLLPK